MYAKLLYAGIAFFCFEKAGAQPDGYVWNIAAGGHLPAGIFHETHFPGISAGIEYSKHRFGKFDSLHENKWAYILGSRLDYYPGRKEEKSGYSFSYSDYFVFHISGGVMYNPVTSVNIRLTAGPALSYYKKTIRFNISSALHSSWYFSPKWGISPGILMITETGARPLWSGSLTANYCF
ncbi:MAG: hypothetical protein FJY20_03830 [Bacteroidetes bacterium]|nr:hypothetical protein [Bacteroidota bacterium]